jgi:hypothetical protein
VAGVDELGLSGAEIDAQQLPGGVTVAVVDQCLVGPAGLLGQAGSRAAGAAQGADLIVAVRAASMSWPMGSVTDRCRVSRSRV